MNTKNPKEARSPLPWWLGGREECGFCLQVYVLEMETRCIDCDRAFCPMCFGEGRTSLLLLCPSCRESEAPR
jgi:hypothetical protein